MEHVAKLAAEDEELFRPTAQLSNGFVREEPLRRVHECCFGVLALESEPVDPRL